MSFHAKFEMSEIYDSDYDYLAQRTKSLEVYKMLRSP